MPEIQPIRAITYSGGPEISSKIAPPYDVLEPEDKHRLLDGDPENVVKIDLPHLPAKTVGPDETYRWAGEQFRAWLNEGVLTQWDEPVAFVYQQTFTARGETHKRRGLIADVRVQAFGKSPNGRGGIYAHEETFSGAKEDRLKLMRATEAQLSPIFGLYSDPSDRMGSLLSSVCDAGPPRFTGTSPDDGVLHELWPVPKGGTLSAMTDIAAEADIFIADGHHRYTTAQNYLEEKRAEGAGEDHPANFCMFVLVALEDPGMVVLPTHRVLGGMSGYSFDAFAEAARDELAIEPFDGDLEALEAELPKRGPHAIGLYDPARPERPCAVATTVREDPLAARFPDASEAWRHLDVAIVRQIIVEGICEPRLCAPGEKVSWQFPHTLDGVRSACEAETGQLGLVLQPTPVESVKAVSEAGELMPQKSTFFYPKLATGLAINPLA